MYRRVIFMLAVGLVCGASVAQAANWDKAVYWDARCRTGWADHASSIVVRDGCVAAGYKLLDADQLKTWMDGHIADGALSVVVFARDNAPNTVVETLDANCTLRKYLDAGGKIVFYADIPFWDVAATDGTWINPQTAGGNAILGFDSTVVQWDSNNTVKITAEGAAWGLTATWASARPVAAAAVDQVLATDNAGQAAAWVKHYVDGDWYRGFVRLYDRTGRPPVEDILRAAEYEGLKAYGPTPASGTVDVTMGLFQWKAAPIAVMQQVYFGTNPTPGPDEAQPPTPVIPGVPSIFPYMSLVPGATYYWRVDSTGADGTVYAGDVWSFTVMPLEAHFPSPRDGIQWRQTNVTLSWTGGQNVRTHDVYFGADQALVAAADASVAVSLAQTATTFAPAGLEPGKTYYWRVDENQIAGAVVPGNVWSFSTIDPNGGAVAEYWANRFFTGEPNVVTTVGEINFDWGGDATPGINSPDANIPVDNFTCRWSAELNVPETGIYRLYEASDDGMRLYLNGQEVAWGWWDRGTTEDATGELELVAGERYQIVLEMYENGGGATAFLRWSGPGYAKEIIPQGALQPPQLPVVGYRPSPGDGATGVADEGTLSWVAGLGAVQHKLYVGTDEALVAAGDASVLLGTLDAPSFDYAGLTWSATYYWKVDAVAADGAVTSGPVWSFSTMTGSVVEDFEAYGTEPVKAPVGWWKLDGNLLDSSGNGHDGVARGDGVGFEEDAVMGTVLSLPGGDDKFVEIGPVGISGNMPSSIACWAKADHTNMPDWTLVFGFTGTAGGGGDCGSHFNIDVIGGPGGTGAHAWCWEETIFPDDVALEWHHYAMTYNGTTIRYFGDGVPMDTDVGKSNVMNLQLRGDRVFIGKRVTAANSYAGNISDARVYDYALVGAEVGGIVGNLPSLDSAWVGSGTVAAGLSVAGHSGSALKLTYDNTAAPFLGDASVTLAEPVDLTRGGAQVMSMWVLGDAANAPATLSVALQDSAGAVDVVSHPDPKATQMGVWWKVNIPLSEFNGVNLAAVTKLSISVGDGTAGGAGAVAIDDIGFGTPTDVITGVARAKGQSGDRAPIGAYDGATAPMPMPAGGVMDGAYIYSDRTFTYVRTPFALMGSEYVPTFNSDKSTSELDVTYAVTTSRAAIVWITVDDRIPAEWNADGAIASAQAAADHITAAFAAAGTFKDTGLDVFAAGDQDRQLSVFAAELPAGTYVFGSMPSNKDFYSIGAIK